MCTRFLSFGVRSHSRLNSPVVRKRSTATLVSPNVEHTSIHALLEPFAAEAFTTQVRCRSVRRDALKHKVLHRNIPIRGELYHQVCMGASVLIGFQRCCPILALPFFLHGLNELDKQGPMRNVGKFLIRQQSSLAMDPVPRTFARPSRRNGC